MCVCVYATDLDKWGEWDNQKPNHTASDTCLELPRVFREQLNHPWGFESFQWTTRGYSVCVRGINELTVDFIGREIEGRQGDNLEAAASIWAEREKGVN